MATKATKKPESKKADAVKKASKAKSKMTGQPAMETGDESIPETTAEDATNVANVVQNKQAT